MYCHGRSFQERNKCQERLSFSERKLLTQLTILITGFLISRGYVAALLYTSNKPVNEEDDVALLKFWKGETSLLI